MGKRQVPIPVEWTLTGSADSGFVDGVLTIRAEDEGAGHYLTVSVDDGRLAFNDGAEIDEFAKLLKWCLAQALAAAGETEDEKLGTPSAGGGG